MGNDNRYRHGRQLLVQVPIASATVVEKGDFVLISGGKATTPSQLLAAGSKKTTRNAAAAAVTAAFLGEAETASANGDTDDILVDVSLESVYELKMKSAGACSFGDQVAIQTNSTASASYTAADDSISIAASTNNRIAVVVREHSSAAGVDTLCKLVPQKILQSASWAAA